MPDVYDSTARKLILNSGLPEYYRINRVRFLALARRLYNLVLGMAREDRRPLPGDLHSLLAAALRADQTFLDDLPDIVTDARRGTSSWASNFAGYIIDIAWQDITREGESQ